MVFFQEEQFGMSLSLAGSIGWKMPLLEGHVTHQVSSSAEAKVRHQVAASGHWRSHSLEKVSNIKYCNMKHVGIFRCK